jgi:hypothetical protein
MKSKYQLLGYCGLFCGTDCEVYRAANSKDIKVKRKMAELLEQQLVIEIDPYSLQCEGCQGPEAKMWCECRICLIRRCAKSRGVKICTECSHYPCPVMELWLRESNSSPNNLQEISELGLDQWLAKKSKESKANLGRVS